MTHKPKNFDRLRGELAGALSEAQLEAHFSLYQGYVKALGTIEEMSKLPSPITITPNAEGKGEWTGTSSRAGDGHWCVLRRA